MGRRLSMASSQVETDKHDVLKSYARRFGTPVFVETGTYKGRTIKSMLLSGLFSKMYTIDIFSDRAGAAAMQFESFANVESYCGDSAEVLPRIIKDIDVPILFWLDAHHTGGTIARSKEVSTPVLEELKAIFSHPLYSRHVVLIDDARYFDTLPERYKGYPTTVDIIALIPDGMTWENTDDIIRIHRKV
jgi:hypothetical protein